MISSGSKPASFDLLRALKVDHIIDHGKQNVVQEVLAATGGRGADVVSDPSLNEASHNQSAAATAPSGVWIRVGPWNQVDEDKEARSIAERRGTTSTFGDLTPYFTNEKDNAIVTSALAEAVHLYETGKVKTHVSRFLHRRLRTQSVAAGDR